MAGQVEQLITEHLDLWTQAQTAKSTSGRGSNNKIELTGIKKLRELILELAVRGQLVPQDPDDEPASELLKRIAADKEALVKAGKLKKQKTLQLNDSVDFSLDIPSTWVCACLGQASSWAIGSGFPTIYQGSAEGDIPFCKVSDMNLPANSKFIIETNHYISFDIVKKIKANLHPEGTIIFPKIGGAIATNKRRILTRPTAIDNNCLGVISNGLLSVNFLYLFLLSVDFTKFQVGTSVPALSQGTLSLIPIGIPPLDEQERIVAKVDELMALCDQLEQQSYQQLDAHNQLVDALLATLTQSQNADELASNWQRLAAHFDTLFNTEYSINSLKQTILQLAVMGKLCKQDPNDEPASELLKRIAAEKEALVKAGKIKKQKPLPPINDDEKPFELPKGWEWCRISDFISLISGQHLKPEEYQMHNENGCVPYITGPAEFGDIFPTYDKYTFEKRAVANSGDILITCKGAGLGKLNTANCEIAISRQLMAVRAILVDSQFLELVLHSLYEYFQSKGVGIAIPGISREDILEKTCFLPPLSEQKRMVKRTNELMKMCNGLAYKLLVSKQIQTTLAEALVEQVVA